MSGMKEKSRKWRALINLAYSPDLVGDEKGGQLFAYKGDITELYPELLAYPDRVELLEKLKRIEPVPETPIVRPPKEVKSEEV